MAALDSLYATSGPDARTHTKHTATQTAANVTLAHAGGTFTLTGAPTPAFVEGEIVKITGGPGSAWCVVKKVTSSTVLTLLPLQTALDTVGAVGGVFNGATIASAEDTPTIAATLVIDLTDAPEGSYNFLIVGCATLGNNTNNAVAQCEILGKALVDDPFSGTSGISKASMTLPTGATPRWVGSRRTTTLEGGQRYEFHLALASGTAGATASLQYGILQAFRYVTADTATSANGDSSADTEAAGTLTTHKTLGSNLPAGQYLICATWVSGINNLGGDVEVVVEQGGGNSDLAYQKLRPYNTADFTAAGFLGVVTLGATNLVRIRFRRLTAGTATIKLAQICAILLPDWFPQAHTSEHLTDDLSATGTGTLKTSNSVSLSRGTHVEIVQAGLAESAVNLWLGPNVGSMGPVISATPGLHIASLGTASDNALPTFWLVRRERVAGATSAAINAIFLGAGTVRVKKPFFSWIRELLPLAPEFDTPITIIADVESGALLLRNWNSTASGVARFFKHLDDVQFMSRVLVNGVEYARQTTARDIDDLRTDPSTAVLDAGQWYWDADGMDLYVQLGSGDAPSDSDQNVIAIPKILVGRDRKHFKFVDSDGTVYPYEPRLKKSAGMTQELKSSNARYEASTSFGTAVLAASEGEFDDRILDVREGIRVKVRRGYGTKSPLLSEFDTISDAVIGPPKTDFDTLTFQLFDRGLLLSEPVCSTAPISVWEGNTTDSPSTEVQRNDQSVPVIYGKVKRVVAYRTTHVYGTGNWNEYQFCDHAVSSVVAAYLDGTTKVAIDAASNLNVTSTYTALGKVRVRNNAHVDANRPLDVIYVDVIGRTADGTTTGVALQTAGAIARDLLLTYGGLATGDLMQATFRLLDRRWRKQFTSGGFVPTPPKLGLLIEGEETVGDALTRLCGDVFAYWFLSREGRVGIAVPDFDIGNLLVDGGAEDDATTAAKWPWTLGLTGTLARSGTRKFDGQRSWEASNGGAHVAAQVGQVILIPREGPVVVTLLVTLIAGRGDVFRIGLVTPGGYELLSDPMEITTGRWQRRSAEFEIPRGECGSAQLRIFPAYGTINATTIGVDNVEVWPVAAVLDETNAVLKALEFRDEHFYSAAIAYDCNLQDLGNASKFIILDGEARGYGTATQEGKFAVQSSKRADFGTPLVLDQASAAGIGGPITMTLARTRHAVKLDMMGAIRIPRRVGERVYIKNYSRLPEPADGYPIWPITGIDYDGDDAQVVELEVERQGDPVVDRVDISPDQIPMGAIGLTRATGAVTDFTESTEMQSFYARINSTPDLVTVRGSYTHTHELSHQHAIPSHLHATTVGSHALDSAGDPAFSWAVIGGGPAYPSPFGPFIYEAVAARGLPSGHSHSIPGGTKNTANGSGTSGVPTAALVSKPGGQDPKSRFVRWMTRTAAAGTTIPIDLIIGWRSITIPAGWARVTALDDYFLRGATALGAVSTTVATSTYTPTDAGSTLNVASGTNIAIGRRLVITNGANHVAVVVTAGSGTAWTVVPLYEVGDNAATTYVVTTSTVTATSQTMADDVTYTPTAHDHGALVASHAHNGGSHVHGAGSTPHVLGTASPVTISVAARNPAGSYPGQPIVVGDHTHNGYPAITTGDTTASSSATATLGSASPAPDNFALVFIKPIDAFQTTIPAGGIMFWGQGTTPPDGWQKVTGANGKLIKGAVAGTAGGSGVAGHEHGIGSHTHTLSHTHGGSATFFSGDEEGGYVGTPDYWSSYTPVADTGGPYGSTLGHAHLITATVSATDPGLSAFTGVSESIEGNASMPVHKRLMLIEKL